MADERKHLKSGIARVWNSKYGLPKGLQFRKYSELSINEKITVKGNAEKMKLVIPMLKFNPLKLAQSVLYFLPIRVNPKI